MNNAFLPQFNRYYVHRFGEPLRPAKGEASGVYWWRYLSGTARDCVPIPVRNVTNNLARSVANFASVNLCGLSAAAWLLSACAGPALPEISSQDIPEQWLGSVPAIAPPWPELNWWQSFETQDLTEYMERVSSNNFDLENSRRSLEIALITLRDAGFERLPEPTLYVKAGGQHYDSLNDDLAGETTRSASGGATLEYTDVLKKPGQYRLAMATYDSSQAQAANTVLQIYRTAALSYFQLLLVRDKMTATQQNLENSQALLTIVQTRVDNGTATPIDALQQRIAVQAQHNNLLSLKQDELALLATLSLLAGQRMQQLQLQGQSLQPLIVPTVKPGLPSDLLTRRPDLVEAEAGLRIANANLELARMAFLPVISLTAEAGVSSMSLSNLVNGATRFVDVSAVLMQTLLDNGSRRRANKRAELQLENALSLYRKTALAAFSEIDVGLNQLALLNSQGEAAYEDLLRAEEAHRIAQVRYEQGVDDYQTLLSTQDTLFSVRIDFLQNKLDRLSALLTLYYAMGGGWDVAESGSTEALFSAQPKIE